MSDNPEEKEFGGSTRLFAISEPDLAELERIMPTLASDLHQALTTPAAPRIRTQLRIVQRILMDIRWDYGPPQSVEIIPAGPE